MNKIKRIISVVTVLSICLSLLASCGKSAEKTTTKESTTNENIVVKEIFEEEIFYDGFKEEDYLSMYQSPENKTEEYLALEKEVETVIEKRGYDDIAKELVTNTFNALYNCYPEWQDFYNGLPSTEEYIRDCYIKVLEYVNIDCYIKGSEKHKKLEKEEGEYEASASHMIPDDNGGCTAVIILDDDEGTPYEVMWDVEQFFHEITHCRAHLYTYTNVDIVDYDVINMLVEGSATFHQKFIKKLTYSVSAGDGVSKSDESFQFSYQSDSGIGYFKYVAEYEKLVFLLGFDTIYRVENGELHFGKIKDKLVEKYGKELGEEMDSLIRNWHSQVETEATSDKSFNLSAKFENKFLECLKKDISKLKTKEETDKFIRMYEHYKIKTMPVIENKNGRRLKTIFDVESIDNALKTKAKKFGISYN